MGWWEQDADGVSFPEDKGLPQEKRLVWGDGPADIIDDALNRIRVEFLRDLGRMPSKPEIIAGIAFSTKVLDDLADAPEHAPRMTCEQHEVITTYAPWYLMGSQGLSKAEMEVWRDAQTHVSKVVRELSLKPEPEGIEIRYCGKEPHHDDNPPVVGPPDGHLWNEGEGRYWPEGDSRNDD